MTTKQAINELLRAVGENGLSGVWLKADNLAEAVTALIPHIGDLDKRVATELKRQRLVEITSENDNLKIAPSISGAQRLLKANTASITIPVPHTWDGRWHIVTFDIPRTITTERIQLHKRIKQLGLYMIQKGIWVYPHPFQQEITLITDELGLTRYMLYMGDCLLENSMQRKSLHNFNLIIS